MPNTITAFYDFVQGTKARAAQVNTNFGNFRGTLVPIQEDTAAASNLTHSMGTTEHRWSAGYMSSVYLGDTTSSWRIADSTIAVDELRFTRGGTDIARLTANGNLRSMVNTAPWVFSGTLTDASLTSGTVGGLYVTLTSITMTCTGYPIELGCRNAGSEGFGSGVFQSSYDSSGSAVIGIRFMKDNLTVVGGFHQRAYHGSTATADAFEVPAVMVRSIVFDITAGVHTFQILMFANEAGFRKQSYNTVQFFAREMY